ncbi:MAG: choice-of-anchor M domain-containing protein [Actinomycetaceae bacterium]|nr:choice-of-anchor M domain-containing protein [Actinomycetaceae bacterium]
MIKTAQLSLRQCAVGLIATIALAAFAMPGVAHAGAPATIVDGRVVLDKGHTDIFNVTASDASSLRLQLKEDVTGLHVVREPEDVYLKVTPDRFTTQTKGLPGIGTEGYVLPITQENNSLWPGWDTFGVAPHFGAVTIVLDKVNGPGRVMAFTYPPFGSGPTPITGEGSVELTSGSTLPVAQPSHTHMYWLFSQKGIYTFDAYVQGVNAAGQLVKSRNATYTWVVDSEFPRPEPKPKPQPETKPQPKPEPAPQPGMQPGHDEGVQPAPQPEPQPESKPEPAPEPAPEPEGGKTSGGDGAAPKPSSDSQLDEEAKPGVDSVAPKPAEEDKPDAQPQPKPKPDAIPAPQPQPTPLPQPKSQPAPQPNAQSSQLAGNQPKTQVVSPTPLLVPAKEPCIPTRINGSAATAGSAGAHGSSVGLSGNQAGGSVTIPPNTHVHQNWVFNQPGSYKVVITESATLKNGTTVSGDALLYFQVGGSGTANQGHFDLGAEVNGNSLTPKMKDDRSQPSKWINPSSVVFGLGSKAKMSATKDMSFIADEGQTVWVIPSAQISGVPWLGANTMSSSVIKQTTGTLTWTLKSVEGPGQLAVFESGNFGKTIGKFWFGGKTNVSASGAYNSTRSANNSTSQVTIEGRTPSGQPCELAQTGVSDATVTVMIAAGTATIGGVALIVMQAVRDQRRRSQYMGRTEIVS